MVVGIVEVKKVIEKVEVEVKGAAQRKYYSCFMKKDSIVCKLIFQQFA